MSRNIIQVNKLEKYIKDKHINQSDIARKMGMSRAVVNNWVKLKNYPPVPTLIIFLELIKAKFEEVY